MIHKTLNISPHVQQQRKIPKTFSVINRLWDQTQTVNTVQYFFENLLKLSYQQYSNCTTHSPIQITKSQDFRLQ